MNAELRARILTGAIDDEMKRQDVTEGEFAHESPETVVIKLERDLQALHNSAQLEDKRAYRRWLCALAARAARALEAGHAKELGKAGVGL